MARTVKDMTSTLEISEDTVSLTMSDPQVDMTLTRRVSPAMIEAGEDYLDIISWEAHWTASLGVVFAGRAGGAWTAPQGERGRVLVPMTRIKNL